MSQFQLQQEECFGSIETRLYSYVENREELNSYIAEKINHRAQNFAELLEIYGASSLDKKQLIADYQRLSTPKNHLIPAFDVRRSTVTEFMAEFLLAKEFQCIFFDRTNKKLNKSTVDADRHSTGIDVTGVQEKQDLKFVVAEVKASQDANIPCRSANDLKKDIEKVLDFTNNRLLKEICSMSEALRNPQSQFEKYIKFLLDLIGAKDSPGILIKRLIIFPFLIRDHAEILQRKTLADFQNFSELETKNVETIGIVWAFNRDIDAFVKSFYNND